MNEYSLVSFDADQTLFDFNRVTLDTLDAVRTYLYQQYEIDVSVDAMKARRDRIATATADPTIGMLELCRRSFEEILLEHRIDDANEVDGVIQIFESIRFARCISTKTRYRSCIN